jgi:hypothetical protein
VYVYTTNITYDPRRSTVAIKVKTESKITGDSEHVVTEEGLKAAGVDVELYRPAEDLKLLVRFARLSDENAAWSDNELEAAADRVATHFGLDER